MGVHECDLLLSKNCIIFLCCHPQALVGKTFVGLAATAALVSTVPKRGEHRAFVACATDAGTARYCVTLTKGARDRAGEDRLVSRAMVEALREAHSGAHQKPRPQPQLQDACESLTSDSGGAAGWPCGGELLPTDQSSAGFAPRTDPLDLLENGAAANVLFVPGCASGYPNFVPQAKTLVYPGSFNPLHRGHLELAAAARTQLACGSDGGVSGGDDVGGGAARAVPLVFEMALVNADKPALGRAATAARLQQFEGTERDYAVLVTRSPLFVDKARLLPNSVFLVGADTAARVLNPRYYGGHAGMVAALAEIKGHGCSFLVGGRTEGGDFLTCADILAAQAGDLPEALRSMFVELEGFRVDLSSTQLREGGGALAK